MFINDIEIDKTGYSDYADWEKNAAQYIQPISQKANQGNATAQLILGMYYLYGEGVEKNEEKAFQWISKAAEQNLGNAQYILSLLYRDGIGTNKRNGRSLSFSNASSTHLPSFAQVANEGFS